MKLYMVLGKKSSKAIWMADEPRKHIMYLLRFNSDLRLSKNPVFFGSKILVRNIKWQKNLERL
jgi:hypothetical protein